jgi:hypothetical protein
MSKEPKEPTCPPDRKPHGDRVKKIDAMLPEGKTGAICIDNTPEHKAWYLHELAKYPRLIIEFQGDLTLDIYIIKVRKGPSNN